ncbi:hypothetical protein DRP07_10070 [Archaeoglobales archaeon]|nr:MAG: hypothetical protein DRP07_10070 [Archaeoglobales archaeon]
MNTEIKTPGIRILQTIVGFVIAFAITYFHWTGLIAAGLVAAFAFKDLKRSLAAGFLFGLVVWILFLAYMAYNGLLEKYIAMGMVFYLSIVIALLIPTLTASVRGLVE